MMFLRLPPVLRFLLAPIRSLPNINPTSVEALGKKDGWKWSKKVESSDSNSIAIRLSLDRSILEGNIPALLPIGEPPYLNVITYVNHVSLFDGLSFFQTSHGWSAIGINEEEME